MDRRGLVIALAGIALLGGTIAVLRDESAPPLPEPFARFLGEGVGHSADGGAPARPTDLALTALDPSSLRVSWAGSGTGGYEVRWGERVRLVRTTETELTGLDPSARTRVEVRALDPLGGRSEPATAEAAPREVHDASWLDPLVQPVDRFDGPEALAPRRWRVLDGGVTDCLGLTGANDRRLEITCDRVDLQSNVPVRLSAPSPDGAVARVVLTTDGPSGLGAGRHASEVLLALLPEPFHDAGQLTDLPPGAVVLRIGEHEAGFDTGEGMRTTTRQVPVTGRVRPAAAGVRHRWELRVLSDALVALRDGAVVATAPVAVPWTTAHARLAFRGSRRALVDTFGVGGAPSSPVAASLVPLGPGTRDGEDAVSLGTVPQQRLAGGTSVRLVAAVGSASGARLTAEFGGRSAPARVVGTTMLGTLVHADFPLPDPGGAPEVRVLGEGVGVVQAHLVVSDGPGAVRPLPRLLPRDAPAPRAPEPAVTVVREADRARVLVELTAPHRGEVAALDGVEVDLDGERVAAIPTGGAAGGRHEFTLDLRGLPTGSHRVAVRAVPVDRRLETRLAEHDFEIRPL